MSDLCILCRFICDMPHPMTSDIYDVTQLTTQFDCVTWVIRRGSSLSWRIIIVTATRVSGIYFEIVIKPEMEPFLRIPDFKLQKRKHIKKVALAVHTRSTKTANFRKRISKIITQRPEAYMVLLKSRKMRGTSPSVPHGFHRRYFVAHEHATRMDVPHTYASGCVGTNVCMSHFSHVNISKHTCENVMSLQGHGQRRALKDAKTRTTSLPTCVCFMCQCVRVFYVYRLCACANSVSSFVLSALQRVAVRCSALQCVAVRCSALQCVAVRRSAP